MSCLMVPRSDADIMYLPSLLDGWDANTACMHECKRRGLQKLWRVSSIAIMRPFHDMPL